MIGSCIAPIKVALALTMVTFSSSTKAEFVAVGPIEGAVSGFIGGTTYYKIAWVQNSKGERWNFPTRYASVDEYNINAKKGYAMCFLKVKSSLPGVLGFAADAVSSTPTFYGIKKGSSSPEKIGPEYLVFQCREVP